MHPMYTSFKLCIQLGVLALLTCLIIYSLLALYLVNQAENDEKKQADVILVLGAKAYRNNSYNPCLVARVQHAVNLYKDKYAPKLLFSGGTDFEDGTNEAQTMEQIASSLGVPPKDILLETSSTSTYENLLYSKKILQNKNFKSIILVTEPFHSPRARLVAKHLKLNVFTPPAIKSKCWLEKKYFSKYFLKEPLAIMYYKITKKL